MTHARYLIRSEFQGIGRGGYIGADRRRRPSCHYSLGYGWPSSPFLCFLSSRRCHRLRKALERLIPNEHCLLLAQIPELSRRDTLWEAMLKKEMEVEREFASAGGLLMAGVDPTGWGGVIAGYGDQRELELLVETGFTPEQAIQVGTYNGAFFLGQGDRIGTLSAGKEADITVVRGNPDVDMRDIRQTQMVFKGGVAYDAGEVLRTIEGQVGR